MFKLFRGGELWLSIKWGFKVTVDYSRISDIKNLAPPPHAGPGIYERLNNHTYLKKIRLNLYFSDELTYPSIEGDPILVAL